MYNFSTKLLVVVLAIAPLIVVGLSYNDIPLLNNVDTSELINNAVYYIPLDTLNEFITNVQLHTILNTKLFSIIISLYPIYLVIKLLVKSRSFELYKFRLLMLHTIFKLLYFDVTIFILYLNLFNVILYGQVLFFLMIAFYFLLNGILASALPMNKVVGFYSKYTNHEHLFKLANKLYAILLFGLCIICLLIPFIFTSIILGVIFIVFLYAIIYAITYSFAKYNYLESENKYAKVYSK